MDRSDLLHGQDTTTYVGRYCDQGVWIDLICSMDKTTTSVGRYCDQGVWIDLICSMDKTTTETLHNLFEFGLITLCHLNSPVRRHLSLKDTLALQIGVQAFRQDVLLTGTCWMLNPCLHTSIPIPTIMDALNHVIKESKINNLPKSEFLIGIEFCLKTTYFIYDDQIYLQMKGATMGSPISPNAACITIGQLEIKALNSLKNDVYYFKRYVDDSILFINQGSEQKILDTFINLLPDINYSMEVDNNKSINFLDMNLSYSNNNITTSIYKKPTHTGTYWNFSSQHHFSQKVGLVKALIYRAFTLINDTTKRNIEINNIKKELINEDFPIKLINRIIEDMNQKYENNTLIQNLKCKNKEAKFISLPFINQKFARNFTNIFKKYGKMNIAWKPCNPISQYLNQHKNTQLTERAGLIYEVKCEKCDQSYVGQTSRTLKERMENHKYALKWDRIQNSALVEHRRDTGHNKFNLENPRTLDYEKKYYKRQFKEAFFIQKSCASINRMEERGNINDIYRYAFNYIKKKKKIHF
ncbi:hypothetical protein LAZ67_16001063 [Cordylochernes scorpioides]|uniref:Helix-turn-helix domain-containing protein n=1 Tax=Cordylochernes scorpioides TaxID=51811 RepID=A0ABY6LB29_9ARAC|nr:hypothetical protein LAZ67_16001063 [Cordylochernes scorpioides]